MMILKRFLPVAMFLLALSASTLAQGWQHIGNVDRVEKIDGGVVVSSGQAKARITFVRPGLARVRVAANGTFGVDRSWAIVQKPEAVTRSVEESAQDVRVKSGDVTVVIHKSPMLIEFLDGSGNSVVSDEPALPMAWDGERVRVWKKMPLPEKYFGLGDSPGMLNRRNHALTLWNTDAFGWQESTTPIYKDIPFFMGVNGGNAYGIFFDNTYRSTFDFGVASQEYYSFGAEGGEINYYYFAGPDPKKIVQAFADLTGHMDLPPYWTLGFQQSRYSYYPEARVREIAKTFRDKKIPARCDLPGHRLPTGLRAIHRESRIFPPFRRDDQGPAAARHPHRADHRPAHQAGSRITTTRRTTQE